MQTVQRMISPKVYLLPRKKDWHQIIKDTPQSKKLHELNKLPGDVIDVVLLNYNCIIIIIMAPVGSIISIMSTFSYFQFFSIQHTDYSMAHSPGTVTVFHVSRSKRSKRENMYLVLFITFLHFKIVLHILQQDWTSFLQQQKK